ncbi:CBS domain-containing protein [Aromatoleum toluclasticum]|uniref:CBS domain-containing protein n=1 Tax=Aromatoleum toluclasticum TaxID=92003 RepID=UPI001D18A9FC|nr:CBS domain-containing protein [Aromatoleum toluclasticum]MCC4114536.1 CBS domain-containing protein [Aromatoleum toluclasticum]
MPHRPIREVIGQRPFPTVTSGSTIRNSSIIMREMKSSAVLIVDKGKLLGILTERDIVFRVVACGLDPATTAVESIMTTKVQTIHKDKPFGHALHLMYEGGFRHMPVVDGRGTPVGLLAAHDALDIDGLQLGQDLVRREEISVIL